MSARRQARPQRTLRLRHRQLHAGMALDFLEHVIEAGVERRRGLDHAKRAHRFAENAADEPARAAGKAARSILARRPRDLLCKQDVRQAPIPRLIARHDFARARVRALGAQLGAIALGQPFAVFLQFGVTDEEMVGALGVAVDSHHIEEHQEAGWHPHGGEAPRGEGDTAAPGGEEEALECAELGGLVGGVSGNDGHLRRHEQKGELDRHPAGGDQGHGADPKAMDQRRPMGDRPPACQHRLGGEGGDVPFQS